MNKFKKGDKVKAYSGKNITYSGHIDEVDDFGNIRICSNWFHPKQCRKLIPNKRRSVWIRNVNVLHAVNGRLSNDLYFEYQLEDKTGCTEFREVVKKK